MKTEDILAIPPKVLSPEQREFYFENGYLLVERAVGDELLERLRAVTAEMVEKSRELTCSDAVFDLEPSHSRETPRLRRLSSPAEHHRPGRIVGSWCTGSSRRTRTATW